MRWIPAGARQGWRSAWKAPKGGATRNPLYMRTPAPSHIRVRTEHGGTQHPVGEGWARVWGWARGLLQCTGTGLESHDLRQCECSRRSSCTAGRQDQPSSPIPTVGCPGTRPHPAPPPPHPHNRFTRATITLFPRGMRSNSSLSTNQVMPSIVSSAGRRVTVHTPHPTP